jgi:phage baseplate assembly protein V
MREIAELAVRIAELERRISGMMRHGTVAEIDTTRHRVRLNFGNDIDGKPFLSPWLPYAQIAGALKVHTPPSQGQQFTALSPSGDWQQAIAIPMTWSDQNISPSSDGDEHVLTFGDVHMTIREQIVEIQVGAVTMKVSPAGVAITGGKVTHEDKNIGASHVHGGVIPGGGLSDVPAN